MRRLSHPAEAAPERPGAREPGSCREYVAVHHRLGVDAGDRLLDVACGSGLAIELARLRGAFCSGVDASARLVAVTRDRNPGCDIRVGDMHGPQTRRNRTRMTGSFLQEPRAPVTENLAG
jgi:SAM-dependent methyltransferase